jgi:hypothetical protein
MTRDTRTLVQLFFGDLLVLDKEIDEVLVVHHLLVLHGYYHPHLIFKYLQGLHQDIAVLNKAHYYLVIVALYLVFIGALFVDGDDLAEPLQHLIRRQKWQLIEANLHIAGWTEESSKLLRLIQVRQPCDILKEFVQEEASLLHKVVLVVPNLLFLRNRRHIQTHEPTEEDISEHVKLFVSAVYLKLPQVITALDLVQVMLPNGVALHFDIHHIDLGRVILLADHQIFEGGNDGSDLEGLL